MADYESGGVTAYPLRQRAAGRGAVERLPDRRRRRGRHRRQRRHRVRVGCATAMGQPELATDARFATHQGRGANMAELDRLIGAWTATAPCDEVLATLDEHGVPAGRIFTAPDMLTDPQYLARDMVRRLASTQGWDVPMTGVVPRFTETPGTIRHTGPALGEHTDEVLRDVLGLDHDEITSLRSDGAVE